MRYAAETSVSCDRSEAEIKETLRRYGADGFMSGWVDGKAGIQFRLNTKIVRFVLPLPDQKADEFTRGGCIRSTWHPDDRNPANHSAGCFANHSPEIAAKLWEQACRQRWRALALAIKAKLEAVECGITTFEEEFLAHIVLPGGCGMTVGQEVLKSSKRLTRQGRPPAWDGTADGDCSLGFLGHDGGALCLDGLGVHSMRTKVWTTREGKKVRVMDMEDSHLLNTIRFLKRAAANSIEAETRMMLSVPTFNGEMAQLYFDQAFDNLLEEEPEDRVPDIYWDMVQEADRRGLRLHP